jgi:hypothetical protein
VYSAVLNKAHIPNPLTSKLKKILREQYNKLYGAHIKGMNEGIFVQYTIRQDDDDDDNEEEE